MSVDDCFREIEDPAFAADVNAASTFTVFLDIMSLVPSFGHLLAAAQSDSNVVARILERIRSLCELRVDFEYENPYDAALSAYAWAVHKVSPDASRIAAELITSATNTWWCTKVAALLLNEPHISSSSTETTALRLSSKPIPAVNIYTSKAAYRTNCTFIPTGPLCFVRVPEH
jgi:hypothetical protein